MVNTPDSIRKKTQGFSPDWLLRGVLTKIGDLFDRMTGRGYKPTSTLATSELIERMKFMLDSEARLENGRSFVPHNIKLKMQWDKFSTDSQESFRALENEFLTAAVDHVNDKRYYTMAPFHVEAKPDYFTTGVKLFVSFESFADDESEAVMSVAVPGATPESTGSPAIVAQSIERNIKVTFSFGGNPFEKRLNCMEGGRLAVGRTKENDLAIVDPSLSKYHASLLLDIDGNLQVADTGSTNGTFVNGERVPYGKAISLSPGDKIRFGLVEASFEVLPRPVEEIEEISGPDTETFAVGEFEFTKRTDTVLPATESAIAVEDALPGELPKTSPSLDIPDAVAPQPQLTASSIAVSGKDDEIELP